MTKKKLPSALRNLRFLSIHYSVRSEQFLNKKQTMLIIKHELEKAVERIQERCGKNLIPFLINDNED